MERTCEAEITESYARVFLLSSHTHAQPAMSIRNCGASGALSGGGGGGGGGTYGGGTYGGGSGPVGIPGEDGVPPIGKSGGTIGM